MKRWCWGAMSRWVLTEMVLARLPVRCSSSRAVPLCRNHGTQSQENIAHRAVFDGVNT